VILFSNTITHRLKYISAFIGQEIAGKAIELTNDHEKFSNNPGAKINYSDQPIAQDEFWIKPVALLFEINICQQQIDCFEINEYKAFYKTEGDFPFDIFAACFYLLSRYEEYLPHEKDIYGRYAHENSLAFKENFLDIPLVNIWVKNFKELLLQRFPSFPILHSSFTFIPTYDIDEAYSYKHKVWWRSAGAAIKDLLKGKFKRFSIRRQVLNNKIPDPFASYSWIDDLHRPHQLKPIYFFLVPKKTGK